VVLAVVLSLAAVYESVTEYVPSVIAVAPPTLAMSVVSAAGFHAENANEPLVAEPVSVSVVEVVPAKATWTVPAVGACGSG